MVNEGIFATDAQILRKAGADVNAIYADLDATNDFVLQSENWINTTCTFDFSTNYAGLTIQVKGILTKVASADAAMRIINADPNSVGRSTATLKLNVLQKEVDDGIKELKSKNTQDFMKADT